MKPGRAAETLCIAALLAFTAAACAPPVTPEASDDSPIEAPENNAFDGLRDLPSPAAAGSGEPNLFATVDGRVLMSWLEPVHAKDEPPASTRRGRFALRFATLHGDVWTEAKTIVEGDEFFVNWADFPVIIESDGTLIAHWLQMNGGRGTSYDVHITRSSDGGETWSAPIVPHHDETQTEHGFVSMVPEADGGFSAIWLDGRDFAAPEEDESPEMSLRATRFDRAGNQAAVALLDPRICDCCQTSATYVGETLVAVYRDRSEAEIRDIYSVRRTAEGWQPPVRVGFDDWQIPGCPVNGPAIIGGPTTASVAWFSLRDGSPEIKVAFSHDAGASFTTPVLLDRADIDGVDGGNPREVAGLAESSSDNRSIPLGRVAIAWVDDSRVAVTWMVARGSDAEIVVQLAALDGTLGRRYTLATTSSERSSGFPRIVRDGDRLIVAWTDPEETPTLRTAALPVSSLRQ